MGARSAQGGLGPRHSQPRPPANGTAMGDATRQTAASFRVTCEKCHAFADWMKMERMEGEEEEGEVENVAGEQGGFHTESGCSFSRG